MYHLYQNWQSEVLLWSWLQVRHPGRISFHPKEYNHLKSGKFWKPQRVMFRVSSSESLWFWMNSYQGGGWVQKRRAKEEGEDDGCTKWKDKFSYHRGRGNGWATHSFSSPFSLLKLINQTLFLSLSMGFKDLWHIGGSTNLFTKSNLILVLFTIVRSGHPGC